MYRELFWFKCIMQHKLTLFTPPGDLIGVLSDFYRYNSEEVFFYCCHNFHWNSISGVVWSYFDHELCSRNLNCIHLNAPGT